MDLFAFKKLKSCSCVVTIQCKCISMWGINKLTYRQSENIRLITRPSLCVYHMACSIICSENLLINNEVFETITPFHMNSLTKLKENCDL